jgi:hypothetical protein
VARYHERHCRIALRRVTLLGNFSANLEEFAKALNPLANSETVALSANEKRNSDRTLT